VILPGTAGLRPALILRTQSQERIMDRQQFEARDRRIITRADQLWQAAGRPEGARDGFTEEARELIAIEENPDAGTLDPEVAAKPIIEEASIMRNLGEFPTLTDQGEDMTYPDVSDDTDIHLSDDDASDSGGVLPREDMPARDAPDISVADGDITSDTTDADNEPPSEEGDLNDDGLPDQPAFRATARRRSE
jgi:hypothetical protein